MLTADQVAFYKTKGYVVVDNVLSADDLAELRAEIERMAEGARGLTGHTDMYDLEDAHTPDNPLIRRIKLPHVHSRFIWDLIRRPDIAGIVAQLIGPDIRLQSTKLNMKSSRDGAAVEWHQDWAFYPYTNDDILALGVMVDDLTMDNGTVYMVPGTHAGPVYDHHVNGYFHGAIDPETSGIDFEAAEPVTGPAGSISLHHVRLVHGSEFNRSGADRRFLLYELAAADAWPLAGSFAPFTDLDEFDSRMVAGSPSLAPRMAPVPVRMPLPKPPRLGSIFEMQKGVERHFFPGKETADAV